MGKNSKIGKKNLNMAEAYEVHHAVMERHGLKPGVFSASTGAIDKLKLNAISLLQTEQCLELQARQAAALEGIEKHLKKLAKKQCKKAKKAKKHGKR